MAIPGRGGKHSHPSLLGVMRVLWQRNLGIRAIAGKQASKPGFTTEKAESHGGPRSDK
jgi:hypothetical protein